MQGIYVNDTARKRVRCFPHRKFSLAGQGWWVLDAEKIKDYLLRDAVEAGTYIDLLSIDLADGHRLMPGELVTLVHTESRELLDMITEIRGRTRSSRTRSAGPGLVRGC
jgi:hypothetical protein